MKKWNVLILGAGAQGSEADQPGSDKIITFAHAFKNYGAELSFFDLNLEKSLNAANKWGGNNEGILEASYLDYRKFDIAIIATPDYAHHHFLKLLAGSSLKLVICEKPICADLKQAHKIVRLYREKGIPLMVNYTRRFLPYYDHLKQYGEPVYGTCTFNRGWLHTATHAIDFFNMIGLDNYRIIEAPTDYRVWDLKVYYKDHVFSEVRTGDMPVWDYYDKSHWHIAENAFNFLEGKEPIKCTGEMALEALEKCFELKERK
jgi:hypothetical protein